MVVLFVCLRWCPTAGRVREDGRVTLGALWYALNRILLSYTRKLNIRVNSMLPTVHHCLPDLLAEGKPCLEGTLNQKERDKTFCLFVCPQATCFANIFMLCHPRVAMTCTYATNVHTRDNSVKYLSDRRVRCCEWACPTHQYRNKFVECTGTRISCNHGRTKVPPGVYILVNIRKNIYLN